MADNNVIENILKEIRKIEGYTENSESSGTTYTKANYDVAAISSEDFPSENRASSNDDIGKLFIVKSDWHAGSEWEGLSLYPGDLVLCLNNNNVPAYVKINGPEFDKQIGYYREYTHKGGVIPPKPEGSEAEDYGVQYLNENFNPENFTINDFTIVREDNSRLQAGKPTTTRYIVTKDSGNNLTWKFEYILNINFDSSQLDAINSGITSSILGNIATLFDNGLFNNINAESTRNKIARVVNITGALNSLDESGNLQTGSFEGTRAKNVSIAIDKVVNIKTELQSTYSGQNNAVTAQAVVDYAQPKVNIYDGSNEQLLGQLNKIRLVTQSEFDSISLKDSNTLYLIKDN